MEEQWYWLLPRRLPVSGVTDPHLEYSLSFCVYTKEFNISNVIAEVDDWDIVTVKEGFCDAFSDPGGNLLPRHQGVNVSLLVRYSTDLLGAHTIILRPRLQGHLS